MSALWARLRDLLDGRALRERVLVFAAAAAIVVLMGYEGFIRPAWERADRLQQQTLQVQEETRALQARIDELRSKDYQSQKERLRRQRAGLRRELDERREALGTKVGRFIRPERLMAFFEELLLARRPSGIQVRRVESLAPEPVELGGGEGEGSNPGIGLFRKGVAVGFRASYRETLAFLDRVEALGWAVQVSKLDYSVLEFPRAEVVLTAHTFLLDAAEADHGQ